jgi:hypothetical protein
MGTIKKAQTGMRVGRSGGRSCGIEKQIRKDERQAARENRQADRQARREERQDARRAPKFSQPKLRSGGKTPAWTRSEGKDPKGGLNRKGVASYRRENPGSKLKMAVTTPPSKLKKGSKAAKRRKSFCARMSGVKGPMRKPNGKPTRKALALRKWNC